MTTETVEQDRLVHAREQGQAQFDSIKEMVERLNATYRGDDFRDDLRIQEEARQEIEESPLSVEIRSGWVSPSAFLETDDKHGFPSLKPAEYCILLCTGGPAVRIVGALDHYGQPETAVMEVQDWFTPWTAIRPRVAEDDYDSEPVMLAYARCFWFGE